MQTFFDYATQMGLKPHKVPLYETIYYGIIYGYAVTLYQFYYTGDMILSVNTTLPAPEDEAALNQFILDLDIKEKYHLHHVHIKNDFIGFHWRPQYASDFISFVEWFFPLLPDFHATDATVCPECGGQLKENSGYWCHMNSSVTKYVHKKCCGTVARKAQRNHAFFPRKKLPTYKSGILGTALAILPLIFLWAYVFRFAEGGVIPTSIFIGLFAWMGYTFAPGYRGIFKPFIMLGITLTELLLGLLLLPLFGSITALPPGSTETSVLIFISFVFAVFLLVLIWIMEAIFYANEKRHGFYGVTTWKNKK